MAQTSAVPTEPENNLFATGPTLVTSEKLPLNYDFTTERQQVAPTTYPANYDFATGTLSNWTPSDANLVQVVLDEASIAGPYLLLNGPNQSATSSAFIVPTDTQSLRFDYMTWVTRSATEQSRLFVEVFSGADYSIYTLLGTVQGSQAQSWQHAVLDLHAFLGQTIKLRFRVDDDTSWGRQSQARIARIRSRQDSASPAASSSACTVYTVSPGEGTAFTTPNEPYIIRLVQKASNVWVHFTMGNKQLFLVNTGDAKSFLSGSKRRGRTRITAFPFTQRCADLGCGKILSVSGQVSRSRRGWQAEQNTGCFPHMFTSSNRRGGISIWTTTR